MVMMLPTQVKAQPETVAVNDADKYLNAPIREVILRGLEKVPEQYVWNNLRTSRGTPFNSDIVRADIRSLTRLGRFLRIEAAVQPYDDGSVAVIFTFLEQPLIQDIQVVGNTVFADEDLLAKFGMHAGDPADDFAINRGMRDIEAAYRDKGYYLVRVEYDKKELRDSGILYLRVREGPRVKITDIRFKGNKSFSSRVLRGEIKSETAFPFFRKGQVDEDRIKRDVKTLTDYYYNHGYLQVRVGSDVRLSSNNREAIIIFIIDEGPLCRLRDIRFEGNTQLADAQLAALLKIQPGDVLTSLAIQRSMNAIAEAYGEMGFTEFQAHHELLLDPEKPVADLLISMREGKPYKTGLVEIIGNDITKDHVIRRDVLLRPDRPLSRNDIDRTRKNLERLRLFARDSVKVTPLDPDPDNPQYRDVLIEVKETNTSTINFGAAVSTDSGLLGQISLTQRNFDITDFPDSFSEFIKGRAFRGGGQTFSIMLQPGNELSNYSISLTDPRIYDTNYLVRGEGFLRTRFFSDFDEQRLGGRFVVGRRLGERWNASITSRWENVDISNIDKDSTVDLFDVEGLNTISSVSLSLVRSSYDDPIFPSQGMRFQFAISRTGVLGGDYNFTRLQADHKMFLPLAEDLLGRRTVISWQTKIGYIIEDNEAPIFERFYLGGRTFRGFDFRGISPLGFKPNGKLSSDHVGGRFLFAFGPEIRYPLVGETFYGVIFADSGIVADEVKFDPYRLSVGAGIRLRVPMLGPAPLAFDFAIPVFKADGDDTRFFSFSVDIPF